MTGVQTCALPISEDIAAAAVYLAGSGASWVTGKLLEIDGAVTTEIVPKDLPDL